MMSHHVLKILSARTSLQQDVCIKKDLLESVKLIGPFITHFNARVVLTKIFKKVLFPKVT